MEPKTEENLKSARYYQDVLGTFINRRITTRKSFGVLEIINPDEYTKIINIWEFEFKTVAYGFNFIYSSFIHEGFADWMALSHQKLRVFLEHVVSTYFDNPYHNIEHIFDVYHNLMFMLRNSEAILKLELKEKSILAISALLHDSGHLGTTSDKLPKDYPRVYELLRFKKNNEAIHTEVALILLNQLDTFNNNDSKAAELDMVVDIIASTDLANYTENILMFTTGKATTVGIWLRILMMASDIGSSMKSWYLLNENSQKLFKELQIGDPFVQSKSNFQFLTKFSGPLARALAAKSKIFQFLVSNVNVNLKRLVDENEYCDKD